jgi:hypothetical protein
VHLFVVVVLDLALGFCTLARRFLLKLVGISGSIWEDLGALEKINGLGLDGMTCYLHFSFMFYLDTI